MISPETLRDGLQAKIFGKKIYSFETIDSTNSCARTLAGCWAEEGTIVISEFQSAGRGRLGRTWVADAGENLMFSLILRPKITPDAMNLLSLVAAVGIARGIEKHTGIRVLCKWPNDLLCGGQKIAGILLEGSLAGDRIDSVIVGIGVNVNQRQFPDDIASRATSLTLVTGRLLERAGLFRTILQCLEEEYSTQAKSGFKDAVARWLEYAPLIGKHITVATDGAVIEGTVRGINAGGGLIVSSQDGEHTFLAGDVTIVDMESYASGH
jgi:BirA family biotin operon repressor/biotin-[acetyl-CoA-carboxylase] ligase